MSEIFHSKTISYYYNNLLASYFKIKKTWKLVTRKYFWSTFYWDIKVYIKGCGIYLTLKIVYHKLYRYLYLLLKLFYHLKDLLMDFLTSLSLLVGWKSDNYDSFLVIIDCLTIMFCYKLVKTIIDITELAKVIISIVVG